MKENNRDLFCKNIRYLRKCFHLTQKEMAHILDISVGSLRKMENGKLPRCVRASALRRVSLHFYISADALLFLDLEAEQYSQAAQK